MKRTLVPFMIAGALLAMILAWPGVIQQAIAGQIDQVQSFTIELTLPAGKGPEAAIDAQIAMADLLELLSNQGLVQGYQVEYGQNRINIQAPEHIRQMLAGLPNVQSVKDLPTGAFPEQKEIKSNFIPGSANADNGSISGQVTRSDTGAPIMGIQVRDWYLTLEGQLQFDTTDTLANGSYQFTGRRFTSHRLEFRDPLGKYVSEFYLNKPDYWSATEVFLNINNPSATNINAVLDPSASLKGKVTTIGGANLKDIVASAWKKDGDIWVMVGQPSVSAVDGSYTIKGLPTGIVRVGFADTRYPRVYINEYYPNHDLIVLAQDIYVTLDPEIVGINVSMGGYARITGAVTGTGGTTNMTGIQVDMWGDILGQWTQELSGTATTSSNGLYTSDFLGTRNYRLRFSDPYGMYATQYYVNAQTLETATDVPVNLGYTTANINPQLSLATATVTQTFGTGWYLVGWPINLNPSAPEMVFAPITSTLDIVYDYDACAPGSEWTFYNPDLPGGNTLGALAPPQGYWVKHTGSAALAVQGQYSLSTAITLCQGWNLIGYPAARPRPVKDVLAPINGKFSLVYGYDGSNPADPWEKYDPAAPVGNDLTTLKPGRAYWIQMTQAATLTIPGR